MKVKAHSWTVLSEEEAIKKTDKSALIHKGTGIPKEIRCFLEFKKCYQEKIKRLH